MCRKGVTVMALKRLAKIPEGTEKEMVDLELRNYSHAAELLANLLDIQIAIYLKNPYAVEYLLEHGAFIHPPPFKTCENGVEKEIYLKNIQKIDIQLETLSQNTHKRTCNIF